MKIRRLVTNPKDPIMSRMLSMMHLNRGRLISMLHDVTDDMLDYTPDPDGVESIGSVLYHIAAVEWSWIFEDLDGKEMDYEKWKYGFATRDKDLEQISGKPKEFYLNLIDETRTEIMQRLEEFTDEHVKDEFIADEVVSVTLEWVCYHLINHEALHEGQISMLKRLYKLNHQ